MRIDTVFAKLKELADENGVSAAQVANALGFARANVSNDLNQLVISGKVKKRRGKPVLFSLVDEGEWVQAGEARFNQLVEHNPSLFPAVSQAKAAVLYPPAGMNILILGETGTGKSMFAELVYDYAREVKKLKPNAPFVIFNCADYANNPQLLLAQLFGCKKGAFTGATEDRVGLLETADRGVLFLDEVHRLPPEGQEIFFTFMDKGIFRRLGESEGERYADVRIFSATTEDPESSLLRTFTRRFPMVIRLPALHERSIQERFDLIKYFLNQESTHLDESITVSVNALRALMSYDCPNNIGQLKSDIRFACAGAYAEYMSGKKDKIRINSRTLPAHTSQALYTHTDHRQIWNKIIGINKQGIIFNGDQNSPQFEENEADDIYDRLNLRVSELKSQGVDDQILAAEIEKDIADYFQSHIRRSERKFDPRHLENVVSATVLRLTEELIRYVENKLQCQLSNEVYYGLATHIENAVERVRKNKSIVNPQLNLIRTGHPDIFNAALDCLRMIERVMAVTLPIDEAGFLSMFFLYSNRALERHGHDVRVIVVAHGRDTASAIVETANTLLGVNYAQGYNVPLEEKAQTTLECIVGYLQSLPTKADVMLLVDMGSLTRFGEEIARRCEINVRTVQLISTLHVIEAIQRAMNGATLETICHDVLQVNKEIDPCVTTEITPSVSLDLRLNASREKKLAVIALCSMGEGNARIIENIVNQTLTHRKNILEVLPISMSCEQGIYHKISELENNYRIIAIVSPFRLQWPAAQFNLDDILQGDGISQLHSLIDRETTYALVEETLSPILQHIEPTKILPQIKEFNAEVSQKLNVSLSANMLIGITMHLACLLDRQVAREPGSFFPDKEQFMLENAAALIVVRQAFSPFEGLLNITLPDDEQCALLRFFIQQ
ncbi:sigma 54-interacting transcriptional regulator [Brenneria corticis]|uniref:Transcription antiterminator BglG n=1 Tax=Brenneria corticis TaxID=2173106 RepID=A0A2U1U162_9GAMM|nr:sigma-54-dependent transcriptional regulator [Brenneria sp. CFCC 11842]PWC15377.1 transcription antiterminator BglG [Brenneria sp. CFCC 11842]